MYADYLFNQGKTIEAADAYAQSEKSFEEIALKLMGDRKALQTYIESKLAGLPSDMNAQRTLLSTWLVEIYLDNINHNYMKTDEEAEKIVAAARAAAAVPEAEFKKMFVFVSYFRCSLDFSHFSSLVSLQVA